MWNSKKILKTLESLPIYAGDIRFISGFVVKQPISVVAHTFYEDDNEEYLVTAPDLDVSGHSDVGISGAFRELKMSIAAEFDAIETKEESKIGILAEEKIAAFRYYLDRA